MTTYRYTKEYINEMIFEACLTQYKKDNPEPFKIVERAGYLTEKYDGRWIIYNPQTQKRVSVIQEHRVWDSSYKHYINQPYIAYDTGKGKAYWTIKDGKEVTMFDFVSYLDKPKNKYNWNNPISKYKNAKDEINRRKMWIKYKQDEIDKAKEKIKKWLDRIQYNTKEMEKDEVELNKIRKEIGLLDLYERRKNNEPSNS